MDAQTPDRHSEELTRASRTQSDQPLIASQNDPGDANERADAPEASEKPTKVTTYVFMFVNPYSGDNKGEQLTNLPIQNFRLKARMKTQVQIYSIVKEDSKKEGIQLILNLQKNEPDCIINVWSGGGDGTIVGVIEDLTEAGIDIDSIRFSCIPFGTGNDFSQAMGWGKTMEEDDIVGPKLENLEKLILKRLEDDTSNLASLDIWEISIKAKEGGGYIEKVVKSGEETERVTQICRNMCVYMALGVQGFVGSGFEVKRKKSRFLNFFVYVIESMKWVAFRKFPSVTMLLSSITDGNGKVLLNCQSSKKETDSSDEAPFLDQPSIELVVQNIPRIWSRDVDLWSDGEIATDPDPVKNREGPTDTKNWTPQSTNDGKLEIFGIKSMRNYLKLQVPSLLNNPVLKVGQFDMTNDNTVNLNFHEPPSSVPNRNAFRRFFRKDVPDKGEDPRVTYVMIDGEFFKIFRPERITFRRFRQIKVVGAEVNQSRIVQDEINTETN